MMRWIVGSSLKLRYLVVAAGAAMLVFGVGTLRDTPVDVFPEFAQPKVEIQTPSLGLSAQEVEELVTVPLEQSLQGLPQLETIRSKSVPQLSSIVLLFERGTDLLHARQLVQERVATVTPTLPTWSSPPFMIQPLSSTSRVMKIGLTSDTVSMTDMSVIAYWKIRARLLRVPGVANTPIWGERLKQLQVHVEPEKLRDRGVSLTQLMDVTADALDAGLLRYSEGAVIGTGGFIDTPNQRLSIRHIQPIVSPESLAEVPLEGVNGDSVLLSDVSRLVWDHQPLAGDAVINDGPGLMLIVEKLPWANTLEVTRGVEQAIEELRPGLPGIEIDTTIFRPATFIEQSIDNLTKALLIGALLVILVLGAFLFEWRAALISLVSIPLSLVAAGLVLYLRDTTVNVMILAGFVIAMGVVVDDAIIDVENIVRRLRQRREEGSRTSTASVVLEASLEVRSAILYATLIIVAAMIPVFFLTGLTGAFFKPLAFSYILAVGASLVVALTVTPALALILLRNAPLERRRSPLVAWLQRGYERVLARIVSRPRWAYATVAATVVAGLAVVPFLGQSLLPNFKERDFLMHWLTSPDTSGPEEVRVSVRACRELRTIPGVRNCGSHIGQALLSDEPYGIYFGENWISVDPAVDYDETLASVQGVVDGYPGHPPRRPDLPEGTHPRGADRVERRRRRAHLRRRPARPREQGRRGAAGDGRRRRARRGEGGAPPGRPAGRGRSRPPDSAGVRCQARRRPPRERHPDRERGGGRHLLRREGVRRARLELAGDPQQPHEHPASCRSTRPTAGRCGSPRSPTCGSRRRRTRSSGRTSHVAWRSART